MTAEPLSSNVVNYLVWRYLQEAGYGNAALHLSRCWIRDPETLPFAKNVQPQTLIHLIQDGMFLDEVQAEATGERNYNFGNDHGRPYSSRNGSLLTLDQGLSPHELPEQANGAVQEPAPKKSVKKRKGKPNGVAESRPAEHVNGDAMDIDTNGITNHVAASVRAESEAVASETESPSVTDIPISTLSIGQNAHVQTETHVVANLAHTTTFIPGLWDSEGLVQHTSWGPSGAPVLLTAGKSLLNIHTIAKDVDGNSPSAVSTVGVKLPFDRYSVTAVCWITSTDVCVSAREDTASESGEPMTIDVLVNVTGGGDDSQIIASTAGLVNTLAWNKERELLLSISTDGERGSIKIWKKHNDSAAVWADSTSTAILDALWISDSAFAVCGIDLFRIYSIDESLHVDRTFDTKVTWDKIKFEPTTGIIAALGVESQSSVLGIIHPDSPHDLQTHSYPDQYAVDIDLRLLATTSLFGETSLGGSPLPKVLLTTSSMSGEVRIWDANVPFTCSKRLSTVEHSHALKISFSPDGTLLAAAGPDAVTVWDVEKSEEPIASWLAQEWSRSKWDAQVDAEFILGWDPDGSRLSIALGNQIAIIALHR